MPKFVRIMLTETCAPAVFDDKESVKPAKVVQLESVEVARNARSSPPSAPPRSPRSFSVATPAESAAVDLLDDLGVPAARSEASGGGWPKGTGAKQLRGGGGPRGQE